VPNILLENGQPIPLEDGSHLETEGTTTLVITVTEGNVIGYSIHNPLTGYFYNWLTGAFAYGFTPSINVTPMQATLPSGLFSTERSVVIPNSVLGTAGLIGSVIEMDLSFTIPLKILQSASLT